MLSPMRLEEVEFLKLVVRAKAPGTGEGLGLESRIGVRHGRHRTKQRFILDTALEFHFEADSVSPFEVVEVEVRGVFEFPANMPDEIIQRFYPVVAMSNLLGIVRGSLLQSTAAFKGGPFKLPLLNLNEIELMNAETEQILFPGSRADAVKPATGKAPARKPSKKARSEKR